MSVILVCKLVQGVFSRRFAYGIVMTDVEADLLNRLVAFAEDIRKGSESMHTINRGSHVFVHFKKDLHSKYGFTNRQWDCVKESDASILSVLYISISAKNQV